MEKILLGFGIEEAEALLRETIKKNNPNHIICEDVIIHKGRDHILEKIKNNNPTVLILREALKGNDDIIQTIYLIKKHFDLRIIFIAMNRKPGDKLLATLVGYSIFDILMGTVINIADIAKLVEKPNTIQNVYHLLPKPVDDNYDESLFEGDEKKLEEKDKDDDTEEPRIRNPFGIIKRDRPKKVVDEEVEDDINIEDIFNNAKPSKKEKKETKKTKEKPKKIFGKPIDKYKEELKIKEEVKQVEVITIDEIEAEGKLLLDKQLEKIEDDYTVEEIEIEKKGIKNENEQERLRKIPLDREQIRQLRKQTKYDSNLYIEKNELELNEKRLKNELIESEIEKNKAKTELFIEKNETELDGKRLNNKLIESEIEKNKAETKQIKQNSNKKKKRGSKLERVKNNLLDFLGKLIIAVVVALIVIVIIYYPKQTMLFIQYIFNLIKGLKA